MSKKVLIVVDKNTRKISGNRISKLLSSAGYDVKMEVLNTPIVRKDNPIAWPSMKEVNHVIKSANKYDVDMLIGVGGGSIIDVTKLASSEISKPFISTPTSAAHDGIASPRASVKEKKGSISKI